MLRQCLGHRLWVLFPEPRAAFDIGVQERDRPGWEYTSDRVWRFAFGHRYTGMIRRSRSA